MLINVDDESIISEGGGIQSALRPIITNRKEE